MGYTPYRTMVMIPDGNSLTFAAVSQQITDRFSKMSENAVMVEARQINVRHGMWSLRINWEDQAHVVVESAEIAERFVKNEADKPVVAGCRVRITTAGDPDPGMDYFNDYVFVLEVLEDLPGVFIFDPESLEIKRTAG